MKYSTMFAPTFSSKKFQEHENNSLSAEISMLLNGGFGYPFGRIYQDAIDVGFRVRHENTGKVSLWYLNEEFKSEEEITHWEFHPTPETLRKFPKLQGYKIIIFND